MLGPKAVELPRGLIEHDGLLKFHHAPPEQLAANRYRAAEYVPTTTTVSATIDPPRDQVRPRQLLWLGGDGLDG